MTAALCLNCGEEKYGPWSPCQACDFCPEDSDSLTKHLLVSGHYMSQEEQAEVAQKVKNGQEIEFDPEQLKLHKVDPERIAKDIKGMERGCMVVVAIAIIIIGYMIWTT